VEVIFLDAVEYRLRFPLDIRHCFKTSSLQSKVEVEKALGKNNACSQRGVTWHTDAIACGNVTLACPLIIFYRSSYNNNSPGTFR
jgi:hypothetical protein